MARSDIRRQSPFRARLTKSPFIYTIPSSKISDHIGVPSGHRLDGRGRDEDFSSPPHRSRRALLTHRAPPSGQTSYDERFSVARRRTRSHYSDRCGISAQCPNRGRLTAVPLGEALPSTTSAGSCLPLFSRFASTMASSDFSSTYMLGVRLVAFPSRPGTRVRAWMRPPRFRAKNFSTCTRSPTARGSSHASHLP